MNIWWTSDFHCGHARIRNYCKRPFSSLEEMDNKIIDNFNSKVKEDDLTFYLGDFCFSYSPSESPEAPKKAFDFYRQQLKCKNVIFLDGSHDSNNGTKSIIRSIIAKYGGQNIYMTHDPKYAKKEFFFNFCGHWHGKYGTFIKLSDNSTIVDLSVENWNYFPVSYNEIYQQFSIWKKNEKTN